MTKTTTQPLNLTNPWESRAHSTAVPTGSTPRTGATGASHAAERLVVADHYGTQSLPPEMHQRLSRTLNPKELARAFCARVLDPHDRCMIFRHRLADQFPGAQATVDAFDLPEHHDYTKMLEFMDTGRWPRATPTPLVQLYPRLICSLLDQADATWKKQVHAESAKAHANMGPDSREMLSTQVERAASVLCDAIRVAHLEGARTLQLFGQPILLSLPAHLTSLRQLQNLTLSNMGINALPQDMGKLRNLEHLTLIDMPSLHALPEGINELPNLKSLTAAGAKLSRPFKLPDSNDLP